MTLYAIRREIGAMSPDEVDAAALRAIICALEYDGLRWVRSFWDRGHGRLDCLYEAQSAAQVREHSMRSNIPCDEVNEVSEILPDTYVRGSEVRTPAVALAPKP